MRRLSAIVVVFSGLVVAAASGQSSPAAHLVAQQISRHFESDTIRQTTRDVLTVTFAGLSGRPGFTIDFIAQYRGLGPRPTSPPTVVDIVVTEQRAGEDKPEMFVRADGEMVPLVARLHSRRSVVATISIDDFAALVGAKAVTQRAFDTDLEIGAGPLGMLRVAAERWMSGR